MTKEEVIELRNDLATVIFRVLQNYKYSAKDSYLFDEDSLCYRIYEDVRDLLEATLSGTVLVCGPGAWLEARCIPGHDACVRFFVVYDDQEALCVDISPYYILDVDPDLVELKNFIKIDSLPRAILKKILENEGEC